MHLIDKKAGMAGSSAIVGGAVPIAAGAALAARLQKKDWVSMVFMGDAATEEGVCSETLNFAALKKLPLIFFCENNFYSVQSSLVPRQPDGVEIWKRSAGFGVASVQVDGNNVLDVHRATHEAVERARRGEGPTFIEARTYRWRAHGGAGDDSPTGYRDVTELEEWRKSCPIEMYWNFLLQAGVLTSDDRARMEQEIAEEVRDAFAYAAAGPNPLEEDLGKHVYG